VRLASTGVSSAAIRRVGLASTGVSSAEEGPSGVWVWEYIGENFKPVTWLAVRPAKWGHILRKIKAPKA
jgi:hypothetical protein